MVPLRRSVVYGLLGASDMEREFSNKYRAGAPRGRVSAPESRYMR
jgi:hypothetical protein